MIYRRPPRRERLLSVLFRLIRLLSRRNTYVIIFLVTLLLLFVGTVAVALAEQAYGGEPLLRDYENAFVFMLQNVAGVGIGAKAPLSLPGRIIGITLVILAAAIRGIFVAAIVSGFVNRLLIQGKGLRRVDLQGHILICGWNSRVKQVVEVLQREAYGAGAPLVLLANLEQNPLIEDKVRLVTGDPSSAADLERAGIKRARAAVVVTDESDGQPNSDSTYDARAVLTVLALKSANPNLHVVAQVRDPLNRPHFERARADEMIVSAEMSEGLLARAALNAGIGYVYSELLRLDSAPEMYVVDAPTAIEGKNFQSALVQMNLRDHLILLGVIESSTVLLCPPPEYMIHSGSRLIVLGNVRPALSH